MDKALASAASETTPCPMVDFVNLVSGKWAIPILYRLIVSNGPIRFTVLKRAVYPITQKELTRQLRLFETRGLVTRQLFDEMPLRVEYQVTALGLSLKPTLDGLAAWMGAHGERLRGGVVEAQPPSCA